MLSCEFVMEIILGVAVGLKTFEEKFACSKVSKADIKHICCGVFVTALAHCNLENTITIKTLENEFCVNLPNNEKVKDIFISPYLCQIYIQTKNGLCYIWSQPSKPLQCLKNAADGTEFHIEKMAVGYKNVVIITKDNKLRTINTSEKLINERTNFNLTTKIVSLKCGNEHCVLLNVNGQVLTFGNGSKGQLGHNRTTGEEEPKVVEALDGLNILGVSAGGWHSAALSDSGDLYVWGWNKFGQLGLGRDIPTAFLPQIVLPMGTELNDKIGPVVKSFDCGLCHTIALTDDGKLWSWGWNKYGQLGLQDPDQEESLHIPTVVNLPKTLGTLGSPVSVGAQQWTTFISFDR